MLRRNALCQTFSLLLACLSLTACETLGLAERDRPRSAIGAPIPSQAQATAKLTPGSGGTRVAILAPISGSRAEIGQALVQAARVALETEGAPTLDQHDTMGTAEGAANAARIAIAAGAGIILGPLTSAETAAVAPIARAAGVPVLAFTNDAAQAQPGVWPLGVTPAQQVQRMAVALQAQGKTKLAGLLPDNEFGRALAAGLTQASAGLGLAEARIRTYPNAAGIAQLNPVVRDIADYANRRGPIEAESRAARAAGTAEARRRSAQISRRGVPPAPFDALLLAEAGENLESIASLLPYYDVDQPGVRVLGPNLWAAENTGARHLIGAWYAAPDPANRAAFDQAFIARTSGAAPPAIATIAFDAAAIARVSAPSGFNIATLTRADGFVGASGLLALQMDGHTRRGLAIFEIQRGGPQMVEPAPQTLSAPTLSAPPLNVPAS